MRRYFFHQRRANAYILDQEGSVHVDLNAARGEAVESLRDIMRAEVATGHLDLGQQLEIVNASGHLLATIDFADAVSIRFPGNDRHHAPAGRLGDPDFSALTISWCQRARSGNPVHKPLVAND